MSGDPAATLAELARLGVVPVVTVEHPREAVGAGRALAAGGLPLLEITLRTAAGLPAIGELAVAAPDVLVGAGTVLHAEQAAAAVEAGARFLASPVFDDDVVAWCRAHDVLVLPGVTTPNEMVRAQRAGVDVVKFFPAHAAGGTATLRAVSAVFDGLRYVPTGGIRAADLEDYLTVPAVVACGGSWIADRRAVAAGDWASVQEAAAQAVEIVARARARLAGNRDA